MTYHVTQRPDSWKDLFTKVKPDLVISTVSGGNFEEQKQIIDCAVNVGVPRFIPPEFGQDSLNEKIQDRLPPSRERARTIDYLRQLASNGSLSWVAAATGLTVDWAILSGNLGFDLKWQSATVHGKAGTCFAASSSAWIGRVISAVIENWTDVQNQYIYVSGTTTNAEEIIECLEKVTGRDFTIGRGDVDECIHEAERRIERGFPDAGMFLMERSVLYDESLDGVRPFREHDAKSKLGLSEERIEGVTETVVHQHEHHGGMGGCGCD